MEVVEKRPQAAVRDYMRLFGQCRRFQRPTGGFAGFAKDLVAGRLLYLENHYDQRCFFLQHEGKCVAAAIAFVGKQANAPHSLGGMLALETLGAEAFHRFLDQILLLLGPKTFLLPMNGHLNFGVSALVPEQPADKVGFLTSSQSSALDSLHAYRSARIDRHYLALETDIDPDLEAKLRREVQGMPRGFATRPLSLARFRRDMAIYNELVNVAMKEHRYFFPFTEEENWDLMRRLLPAVTPALFRFLLFEGKEIGYCFAVLDFNQVLGASSDWLAGLKLLALRRRVRRGRIVASGILPEFQGQGVFKYVRNRVLLSFWDRGITRVESSYIDETNATSLGNVRSKGARISHRFALYRSPPVAPA